MIQAARRAHLSLEAYLAAEAVSELKHEWLRGEIFDMAGGSLEHAALAAAVAGDLRAALADRPCRVFSSDLRVFVREAELVTYPDVSVVGGRPESPPEDPHAIVNPTLIVEVLSDSTESYDRGEKFEAYRRLAPLQEYVLVSQRARRVDVFRRLGTGRWELSEHGEGATVRLESVGAELSVDAIYFDPTAPATPR
ncbi:Uma2 family endonuclease [Myxococcota bacterium]|nr:Uma2 family endonuclease [Myxococcota bacterium]